MRCHTERSNFVLSTYMYMYVVFSVVFVSGLFANVPGSRFGEAVQY